MRVLIKKPVTLAVLPGSEVEISEKQFRAARAFCEPIEADKKDAEEPVLAATTAEEVAITAEIPETAEVPAEKPKRKRNTKKKSEE